MIDRTHPLPIIRQCQLLELALPTAYYQATPVSPDELALMCRIDELHLEHPFGGARMLSKMLKRARHPVGRRPVSQAQHQQAVSSTSGVSLPVARSDDHPFQSRVGGRHHLYPDATRLRLFVRRDRLGEPPAAVVASVCPIP